MRSRLSEFMTQRLKCGLNRRLNNAKISRVARDVARREPVPSGQPVIFFKPSTGIDDLSWNSGFHLLASWALRLQGTPVVYFTCHSGMSKCVLGVNREDPYKEMPCRRCIEQSRALYAAVPARTKDAAQGTQIAWFGFDRDARLEAALKDLSVEQLAQFEYAFENEILPLGALCLPALRWTLRIHHLNDDETTRYLLREYILSAWNVARKFSALLDETRPRAVIVFNGQFFPEATAAFVARARGVRVITHEVGLQPASAFFTEGEATAYPINIPNDFELNDAQNKKLDAYLAKRFKGDFTMAGIKFWADMKGLDQSFLQKAATFKQIVPIFTNVVFDTSQPHANTVFEDMFDWLDLVLDVIKAHPETLFVIRAHPDELRVRKASRETVGGWIDANKVADLPNVIFVAPNETLSSYELIRQSKFTLIYNSTIGLEASIMGAAVLCAGKARFTQYPTVFFPQTVDALRDKLEEFLIAEKIEVPAEFKRNARRFLYYQLYRTSLPFGDFLGASIRPTESNLRTFSLNALQNSSAIKTFLDGVLNDGDFLLKE